MNLQRGAVINLYNLIYDFMVSFFAIPVFETCIVNFTPWF